MPKHLTNNQILIDEIINQEFKDNGQFPSLDSFFELFAAQQVLKNYDLSDAEIEEGLTGGGNDGGCDGIYIFANNEMIREDEDVQEKYKKDVVLTICIVQAKNTNGFSEDVLLKWKDISANLLRLETKVDEQADRYSPKVRSQLALFRDTYVKLIRRIIRLNIQFYYVSKGQEVHPTVSTHAKELQDVITRLYPSKHMVCSVTFIGADDLMDLTARQTENVFYLKLTETPISIESQQVYVCLVNLADYYRFITNENDELKRHIFESNVRDYQGPNAVNKQIQVSLQEPNDEDFWWLNNGVTIIADRAGLSTGKLLSIEEPEIVNGLQTSFEVYGHFSSNRATLEEERRNLLVRVVVPTSDDSRDRIILATNSQTLIPKASLRATDLVHRQIEMYLKPRELYYDRRKNYYKNQGKKSHEIVSVSFLAQCLMSILLQRPNDARARPSTLLNNDDSYEQLYINHQNLGAFYSAAKIGKKVEATLRQSGQFQTSEITDILFYVVYVVVARAVGSSKVDSSMLNNLDPNFVTDNMILDAASDVYLVYLSLGGTDKVAKGSELIGVLQSELFQQLGQ